MHKISIPQSVVDRVVARRGREHIHDDLDPAKTALVVIDMQNAFMLPGVAHSLCLEAQEIVPNINKLAQAVNLGELRKQKLQVEEYVTQLEKQLPGKAEMDALLSDINQAGLGRSLQFELFRPGQISVKDYYAELPIAIRVTGRYHDIGSFAADIANLSRIVTLHNMNLVSGKELNGVLSMDATARTYRYLDPVEIEEARKAAVKAKPPGAKPPGAKP